MAQSDLNSMPTGHRQSAPAVTADQALANMGESINDVTNQQNAKNAGVRNAAFINYDAALDAYSARTDVENLTHKNARNHPNDFADADFMRKYDADAQDHNSSGVTAFQSFDSVEF